MNMSCFFREKFYHYFLFVAFFQVQQYMCTIFFRLAPLNSVFIQGKHLVRALFLSAENNFL